MEPLLILGGLIVGFGLLIKGADFFIDASSSIARNLGVSELIIALTLVSVGTSLPELGISSLAVLSGYPMISISNIIGSNIFNLCVALGIVAFLTPVFVENVRVINRDCLVLLTATLAMVTAFAFNIFFWPVGLIALASYLIYLRFLYKHAKEERPVLERGEIKMKVTATDYIKDFGIVAIGIIAIYIGAQIALTAGTGLAELLSVPEWIIGAALFAFGTSIPELTVSLVALKKGKLDISVGNAIGSNIFNITVVLGVASLITPLVVNFWAIAVDLIIVMFSAACITYISMLKFRIHRKTGIVLMSSYAIYIAYLLF